MNTGLFIALGILAIYVIVGPLVLCAIYVFLDNLAQGYEKKTKSNQGLDMDPCLWGAFEVKKFLKQENK